MPRLQRVTSLISAQQISPRHLPLRKRCGKEAADYGRVRSMSGGWYLLSGILSTPCNGDIILLPGTNPNSDGWWLDRSCQQPLEGKSKLGEALTNPGEVEGRCAGIVAVLPGRCAGNLNFWLRYMGGEHPHCEVTGGGSTIGSQGGYQGGTHGNDTMGSDSYLFCSNRFGKWYWRRWKPTFPGDIIQWHSSSQIVLS